MPPCSPHLRTPRILTLAGLVLVALSGPARAEWARAAESEVPLDGNGGSWQVHATLNGRLRGLFLLDTGASVCVITPEAAQRLRLPAGHVEVAMHTANGDVRAPLVELGSVEVGSSRAQGVQAVVYAAVPAPLDGIIGLSFLNRFTYAVVPSRRVLRLR